MDIDADCLYDARPENLERLALALGQRLPPRQGRDRQYTRKLVRTVLKGLDEDRRRSRPARRGGAAEEVP